MSLRVRLFLMLSGLVLVLVLAQWWWVQALARDLSSEVDLVALEVGSSVASMLSEPEKVIDCEGDDCDGVIFTRERVVRVIGGTGETEGGSVMAGDVEGKEPARFRIDDELLPGDVRRKVVFRRSPEDDPVTESADEGNAFVYSFDLEPGSEPRGDVAGTGGTWVEERIEVRGRPHPARHLVLRLHMVDSEDDVSPHAAARPAGAGPIVRRIPIPQDGVEDRLERFSQRLMLGSAGLLGLGLLLAAFLAHRVSAPLRQLASAAHRLGEGELGTQVEVRRPTPEVGLAVAAFNRMSRQLRALDKRSRALQARQHLGEIGEIGRGLAHTLRNPLNALGLSVDELAARAPADDATAELGASARRQIRRIDHGIRSFLALASQGRGAAAAVDVAALAQDVVLEALQDSHRRVPIELDAGDAPLPELRAVAPELRAVLQALVVNAVEASPEDEAVVVRLRPADGNEVRVEVLDRGPGLPAAVRERLFEPHLSTKANGSGMGLFLAQRIAGTRYGGTLELHDREGGGTRAVLRLGPRRELTGETGETEER